MTLQTPLLASSPLLTMLKSRIPGDIHSIAAKVHLLSAFETCKGNTLKGAVWNGDKTALIVTFAGGNQSTLLVEGWRLLTKCTCREWQPARNCPHVVIAWATLKRLVSPETLLHMKINQQMLSDMKHVIGLEAVADDIAVSEAVGQRLTEQTLRAIRNNQTQKKSAETPAAGYRLVISASRHGNGLAGSIMRGDCVVPSWATSGISATLARFLVSHFYYEPTPRYYESFLALTNGAYPIVYRDAEAHETVLVYKVDDSRAAGIAFDIRGQEVFVSCCLDKGSPIPHGAILHGQLLIDPQAGSLYPVTNRGAWKLWEAVVDDLDSVNDPYGCDDYDFEDDEDDEDCESGDDDHDAITALSELRRIPNGVAVPLHLFNQAGISLNPELLDNPESACCFLFYNSLATQAECAIPSYLLDIPRGMAHSIVALEPVGTYNGHTFPCSGEVFWLLDPAHRSGFSGPMKTKKRVRAVFETAFALRDEPIATKRAALIRKLSGSPDFLKRVVKREAKQLLTHLADQWSRTTQLLEANQDGWLLVTVENDTQARMLRILYETFGMEAFERPEAPGGLEVPAARLLKELPDLMLKLQAQGFSLRVGSEPLVNASWSFSLDATSSSLDWFELKPEIRCNGEILTEVELCGLLEGGGMVRRDGQLLILDDVSARVLAMFAGAMPTGKKKKKGEQELVRVPRLQILDWLQLRSHGVEIRLSPDDARILENLVNFSSIPERPLPVGLNATLRHYQIDAWHWLAFLYEHRFGACLADDMGLGKTLQGITLLAGIMSGELASAAVPGTPHLVVAPPSLLFNWEAEIARFLPAARVMLYTGTGRSSADFAGHDVIITSYGIVQRDCDMLAGHRFDVLIFDETQMVKNLQAATSNAVRKLKGSFTLALTGTPVENHLGEYYAIMDLCLPGLLGTREEFSRTLGKDGAAGTARLIGRTKPFVLRRTKQLIANELPPKIEMDIPLELTTKQKAFYQRTVEEVRGQVKEAYESRAPAQARIIALTAILRLRQICLAPSLASPDASSASPKLEFLAEQLAELRDEGHSALVFSQFTGYLDIIEKGLREQGFSCVRLDGSTPVPQRKKLVQAFQNSEEPMVFLISLKAGGKGLNLTRATYVYHMDPWWNPAVENQASDRAHRIGQTEQVTITRLIMRHTIEEKMMALKEQKTRLYKAILEDGAGGGGAGLTREEFEFLLG
ncbi:MAG: DEAD/DEAH box helicase [Desulfuromonadales bacterium]|nr:DEAD/DEAH box helicase [Desulfuromonadales bacterium]